MAEAIAGFDTRVLVADAGDAIAGYATFGPARDDDLEGVGELRALFVDPAHWGAGVARRLAREGSAWLAAEGYHQVIVWSFRANGRANAFYEREGFRPEGREAALPEFAGLVACRWIADVRALTTPAVVKPRES